MPPITRQHNTLRARLARLPLELRRTIYEFAVVETTSISFGPRGYYNPCAILPQNFKVPRKAKKIFPTLIHDLGISLAPIVLEAREVYFRKNTFRIEEADTKAFVATMRQLGVDHWIHNIEVSMFGLHIPPRQRPWECMFFDLLSLPLRRLEVDTQFVPPNTLQPYPSGLGQHALQDYQMQMMLLEKQKKKRLLMAREMQQRMPPPDRVRGTCLGMLPLAAHVPSSL